MLFATSYHQFTDSRVLHIEGPFISVLLHGSVQLCNGSISKLLADCLTYRITYSVEHTRYSSIYRVLELQPLTIRVTGRQVKHHTFLLGPAIASLTT